MACNISNLACHTCIASIDLTNFYKRHSIFLCVAAVVKKQTGFNLNASTLGKSILVVNLF